MPSAPPPRLPRPAGHGELVHLLQYANRRQWALNSAVECHLHTVEVIGSNPIAPTIVSLLSLLIDHGETGVLARPAGETPAAPTRAYPLLPWVRVLRLHQHNCGQ
jgi:hypothetical protein